MEIRKPIPGYESYYVSNMGNVKTTHYCGGNQEKNLKQKDRKGYLICYLSKSGKHYTMTVSRLVAMAFIPNPESKRTVNHKNGIRHDNRLENLERATDSENCKHRFTHLGHKATYYGKFGYDHNCSKEVIQYKDGKEIGRYGSMKEAERKTGIKTSNISFVCKGKGKSAGGFQRKHA